MHPTSVYLLARRTKKKRKKKKKVPPLIADFRSVSLPFLPAGLPANIYRPPSLSSLFFFSYYILTSSHNLEPLFWFKYTQRKREYIYIHIDLYLFIYQYIDSLRQLCFVSLSGHGRNPFVILSRDLHSYLFIYCSKLQYFSIQLTPKTS